MPLYAGRASCQVVGTWSEVCGVEIDIVQNGICRRDRVLASADAVHNSTFLVFGNFSLEEVCLALKTDEIHPWKRGQRGLV